MKILFSVPSDSAFEPAAGTYLGHTLFCTPRSSDWGKRGWSKRVCHLREALRIARSARHFDALILCAAGIEAFLLARLRPWFFPRTRLVIADFLIPKPSLWLRFVAPWLRLADTFLCIRSGDERTLAKRFGVNPHQCRFAHFPAREVPHASQSPPIPEQPYVYSAGFAHRDWSTLIQALRKTGLPAILSPGFSFVPPPDLPTHIRILPPQPPEIGRTYLLHAALAVFSMEPTELPSGPLVLLDAMMLSKPIVATSVNGTRDYLHHDEDALLVPPRDADALAAALLRVWNDPTLGNRLGSNARTNASHHFTHARYLQFLLQACVNPPRQNDPAPLNARSLPSPAEASECRRRS
jgi:glycosyltransferase involved in cell wall biosynthesis